MTERVRFIRRIWRRVSTQSVWLIMLYATGALMPINAEEICEYQLFSEMTQTRMRVCEMPAAKTPCGVFPQQAYPSGEFKRYDGRCRLDNVIGICVLPRTKLVFYEGELGILETGCAFMKGSWRELATIDRRDANFLNRLRTKQP